MFILHFCVLQNIKKRNPYFFDFICGRRLTSSCLGTCPQYTGFVTPSLMGLLYRQAVLLPVERERIVLLDEYIEGAVLRVPGVDELCGPVDRGPVQQQVQVGRQGLPGRHRPLCPAPLLLLDVPVPIALDLLHPPGDESAHASSLAPSPALGLSPRVGALPAPDLGLDGRDEEGAGREGVAVAGVGVQGLTSVPLRISGAGFSSTGHSAQPQTNSFTLEYLLLLFKF